MMKSVRTSFVLLVAITLLFGGAYPLLVTGVAHTIFPTQAKGSLIIKNDKVRGSELLGQEFTDAKYFWGRPSATTPAYNAAASSASHRNPANAKLIADIKSHATMLQRNNGDGKKIPIDLVTGSGSGLDPHISLASAEYQLARVANARGMREKDVRAVLANHTQYWLGTPYVNVLKLNMALDKK
jgi:K+-transporting ATPase ATPase C chain